MKKNIENFNQLIIDNDLKCVIGEEEVKNIPKNNKKENLDETNIASPVIDSGIVTKVTNEEENTPKNNKKENLDETNIASPVIDSGIVTKVTNEKINDNVNPFMVDLTKKIDSLITLGKEQCRKIKILNENIMKLIKSNKRKATNTEHSENKKSKNNETQIGKYYCNSDGNYYQYIQQPTNNNNNINDINDILNYSNEMYVNYYQICIHCKCPISFLEDKNIKNDGIYCNTCCLYSI